MGAQRIASVNVPAAYGESAGPLSRAVHPKMSDSSTSASAISSSGFPDMISLYSLRRRFCGIAAAQFCCTELEELEKQEELEELEALEKLEKLQELEKLEKLEELEELENPEELEIPMLELSEGSRRIHGRGGSRTEPPPRPKGIIEAK